MFWRIVIGFCVFSVVVFAAWGTWLLTTDDPDGGAHAGGYFMLALAVVARSSLAGPPHFASPNRQPVSRGFRTSGSAISRATKAASGIDQL